VPPAGCEHHGPSLFFNRCNITKEEEEEETKWVQKKQLDLISK